MNSRYMKSLVNILLFLASVLLVCLLLPRLILFFMPLVIGWIIAMIANPLVRFMEKRMKIVRKHSSMLIIIGAVALVVFGGYFAISRIAREIYGFIGTLPELYNFFLQDLAETENNLQGIMSRFPPNLTESLSRLIDSLTNSLGDIIGTIGTPTVAAAGSIARNIPNALINVIFAVLSAYFFIAEREKILQWGREHTPDTVRQKWQFIMGKFRKAVGGYFKAQFKIMGVVALILLTGFAILRINYAVLFALLIALLDFLPFLGTGTVLIPWAVLKILSADYEFAVGLIIIYLVSQLVRQLIQPKIVGDTIGLNPLATLFCMFIGYKIGGIVAMIIAVPVGMILISLYESGAFDDLIGDVKTLAEGLNRYRKDR
ncbi:sporulation integral membrane protein YtvI [Lachnoclostridium sp. An131]|uniref:sporulation integral membrane protein YtvI n=1 Tax=Lachnoclostridium sp. An131 TaxID=1965555 RepID=UPI000B389672|nr:sporulation integral membrane protein YtvI [Lachnoclostridium sp. An131]OUQ23747.1 sporulation integral membrane protein YtvI [Lachnoclostridium sp. An131]